MSHSLVAALTGQGFFDGLNRVKSSALRQEILERGWPAIFEESHRVFWVDPAALRDAGVGELLLRLRPFLQAQGVQLGEIVDDYAPEGYSVELAQNAYRIFDRAEIPTSLDVEAKLAEVAFARTVYLVNDLLARAGSAERLFALSEASAKRVIFLSPEMYDLIVDHPEASVEECPYVPSADE